MLLQIIDSSRKGKRFVAVFSNGKKIHFGLKGGSTYVDNHDKKKRQNYIARHQVREDFNNPYTAGSLSRWILWGEHTDINKNIVDFKNRFTNGEGIFGDIYQTGVNAVAKVGEVTRKVIFGSKELPPDVQRILKRVGDATITGIRVGRTPVSGLITGTIKFFSSTPYDTLFHLFIIMTTDKGEVLLEKNEVIHMLLNPTIINNVEYLTIDKVPNITINELLEKTKERMGLKKFLGYNAYGNNCQNFLMNVFKANGITEGHKFIKQNTEGIFKNHPTLAKFAKAVTDLGAKVNIITQGGKISFSPSNNGLNTSQLIDILDRYYGIKDVDVYSKNLLPAKLENNHWYIINLQSSDEGDQKGTHWVCMKTLDNQKTIAYYDAFGLPPPIEVLKRVKDHVFYSTQQIQDIYDTTCGYFCIGAILSDKGYGSTEKNLKDYLKMFDKNDTTKNDKILETFLNKKLMAFKHTK